jgi:hypothetical protein
MGQNEHLVSLCRIERPEPPVAPVEQTAPFRRTHPDQVHPFFSPVMQIQAQLEYIVPPCSAENGVITGYIILLLIFLIVNF